MSFSDQFNKDKGYDPAEETRRRKIERLEHAALTILPGIYAAAPLENETNETLIDISFSLAEKFIAEADKRASAP